MDPSNKEKERMPEVPRFLDFPCVPDGTARDGKPVLNKYSSTITRAHDFPGAQVRHDHNGGSRTQADLVAGHALRRRSARSRRHEEQSARGRGVSLVGGESMQVRELFTLSATNHFG